MTYLKQKTKKRPLIYLKLSFLEYHKSKGNLIR